MDTQFGSQYGSRILRSENKTRIKRFVKKGSSRYSSVSRMKYLSKHFGIISSLNFGVILKLKNPLHTKCPNNVKDRCPEK